MEDNFLKKERKKERIIKRKTSFRKKERKKEVFHFLILTELFVKKKIPFCD